MIKEAAKCELYFSINILIVLLILNITCLPAAASRETCFVALEPKILYAVKHRTSTLITCEAYLPQYLHSTGVQFYNPVFDLTFGDEPRTGIFILRGNYSECNERKNSCRSEFSVNTWRIQYLFLNKESIPVICRVADQLKHIHLEIDEARCENSVILHLNKVLRYGQSCLPSSPSAEEICDNNMICRRTRGKLFESEYECVCAEHYATVRMSTQSIICAKEAKINHNCTYTEQCRLMDEKTVCKLIDNESRKCDCDDSAYVQNEQNICIKEVAMLEEESEIKETKQDTDNSDALIGADGTYTNEILWNNYVALCILVIICFYF